MKTEVEMEDASPPSDHRTESIAAVRQLILGTGGQHIKHAVSDVVSEALLEREQQDGSVNKVLVPLVERSLERSIDVNRERIVSSLYPLVGSLVRKAVSTFLVEFVDKTNRIIESSFSARGIVWRLRAWQAGVSYADYVATQIYQYRIEQLIVIHRETGTLLTSVAIDAERGKHADLLSSMLVAINDFVADAVIDGNNEDTSLYEVTTNSITLKLKIGPQAILVAAVMGKLPPEIQVKLQQTLEEFHHFYAKALADYDGDNSEFESAQGILVDSLLSDKRAEYNKPKKASRWPIWLVFIAVFGYGMYSLYAYFLEQQLAERLWQLNDVPGIVVERIEPNNGVIDVAVLRDAKAVPIAQWLATMGLEDEDIAITERGYLSTQPAIQLRRIRALLTDIEQIKVTLNETGLALTGVVSPSQWQTVKERLMQVPGIEFAELDLSGLDLLSLSNNINNVHKQALIKHYEQRIQQQAITFAVNASTLTSQHGRVIADLAADIRALESLLADSGQKLKLLIIGSSDQSGTSEKNKALSAIRATAVKQALIDADISEASLVALGMGELSTSEESSARLVMFALVPFNLTGNTDGVR